MNNLTQKEAERCRKACGWEYHDKWKLWFNIKTMSPWEAAGIANNAVLEAHNTGREYNKLPLDPHFWFGRLWEKLLEKCGTGGWFSTTQDAQNELGKTWMGVYVNQHEPHDAVDAKHDHPCIALAAAIEALDECADSLNQVFPKCQKHKDKPE